MTEAALIPRLDQMASAMKLMASMLGTRIDRNQLAERLGVHRNTLRQRLTTDTSFPRPGKEGKWLLSEIIAWEQQQ